MLSGDLVCIGLSWKGPRAEGRADVGAEGQPTRVPIGGGSERPIGAEGQGGRCGGPRGRGPEYLENTVHRSAVCIKEFHQGRQKFLTCPVGISLK